MKKIILSIITCIYLMVSTGFGMDIHFCMNERVGVDFFAKENEKCGRCGMAEKNTGCCHDQHQFYKFETAGKLTQKIAVSVDSKQISVLPAVDYFTNAIYPVVSLLVFYPDHFEATYSPPPLYILHCVYRK